MDSIAIPGCRHDILGYNLKAIGLLRALATCAAPERLDTEVEGWWDMAGACFVLRSPGYPDRDRLVEFFSEYYQPTPVAAAWNKDPGLREDFARESGRGSEWETASSLSSAVADEAVTPSEAFLFYRESSPDLLGLALDAISSVFTKRDQDNPLFLNKGISGRAHVMRTYWTSVQEFTSNRRKPDLVADSLFARWSFGAAKKGQPTGKGAPFFPDAIKTYNTGLAWKAEVFPFNALDYLLAAEGAFALRGVSSRTLAANSRRFAAFPFVFDTGEDRVSYTGDAKGTAAAIWLPLWPRPTTYIELESFICDAQARLPRKEARFSSEFARALHSQGVDAGFTAWQEFRFKMRASDIPWPCTGRFWESAGSDRPTLLNGGLAPLDESAFLDQFEVRWKGNKIDTRSPHPMRAEINSGIEDAIAEATPENCLEVLLRIFGACRRLALSKSFRETIGEAGQRVVFFNALPQEPWEKLLEGLGCLPEFRIARALASIGGMSRQADGRFSDVQPFLGSLLPIVKDNKCGWRLPRETEGTSKQAVWSGTDLCLDLAHVLARRYLDSLKDDRPALLARHAAPLEDILAFLGGELDDHRITRWTEALSLIGWHWEKNDGNGESKAPTEAGLPDQGPEHSPAIPLAYAALRSLLEIECEWQGPDPSSWVKRRSQRPLTLLCQRSPSSLPLAVEDALHSLSIWGVPNCWGEAARRERDRLEGNHVIGIGHSAMSFDHDVRFVHRLAAAVAVPLDWRDRWRIFRFVTLPPRLNH